MLWSGDRLDLGGWHPLGQPAPTGPGGCRFIAHRWL